MADRHPVRLEDLHPDVDPLLEEFQDFRQRILLRLKRTRNPIFRQRSSIDFCKRNSGT